MIQNNKLNIMSFERLTHEHIINAFTLKPYNFRKELVFENELQKSYYEIKKNLNIESKILVKPVQTHTNVVKCVTSENVTNEFKNVDGLVTNLRNVALVTSLADCQGILLYDPHNKVIGNIHSGWRGTLNRIIENAINLMIKKYNCNPSDIEAYITPSILQCCFEVETDVMNLFFKEFQDINIDELIKTDELINDKQKYFIDTVGINKRVLLKLGLKEDNIVLSNYCTKCNSDLVHSHRSEGKTSGRNIAIICMN